MLSPVRDILFSLVIVAILLTGSAMKRGTRVATLYTLGVLLLTAAMTMVFRLAGVTALSGFHTDVRMDEINFIPFVGMLDILREGDTFYIVVNLLGNLVMFLPLGFLLPLLCPRLRRFWKVSLWGLGTSLLIECSQLFLSRGTDMDDLILNTAGAMLGYVFFLLLCRLFPSFPGKVTKDKAAGEIRFPLAAVLVPYGVVVLLGFCDRFIYFTM